MKKLDHNNWKNRYACEEVVDLLKSPPSGFEKADAAATLREEFKIRAPVDTGLLTLIVLVWSFISVLGMNMASSEPMMWSVATISLFTLMITDFMFFKDAEFW